MTDNEIIKALELCFAPDGMACSKCPYHKFGKLCKVEKSEDSLDLIHRQKAEIKRQKEHCLKCAERTTKAMIGLQETLGTARAEAIKEFAEKLKHTIHQSVYQYWNTPDGGYYLAEDVDDDIDSLVEEMTVNYESSKQRKEDESNGVHI